MLKDKIKYKDLVITFTIVVLIGLVGYKLLDNVKIFTDFLAKVYDLILPFIYGAVIAYILNPIAKTFIKWFKVNRGIAILLTYAMLVGVIVIGGIFLVPYVVDSFIDITTNVPTYISAMQGWLDGILNNEEIKNLLTSTGLMENFNSIITQVGNVAVTVMDGIVSWILSFSSQVFKFILGILISIYVITDKDLLIKEAKRVTFLTLKEKKGNSIIELIKTYNNMIGTYIGIKAIDSAIIGVLAFILLQIVGSEYALLLAVIVGFTNMIPYFGPFIGEIVGVLFNVFASPTKAIIVFGVLLGLQIFDGWYLDPKLIGDKVGVRPISLIFGVVIGGGFFGPIGMLLASPTVATIKIYYNKVLNRNKELLKNVN